MSTPTTVGTTIEDKVNAIAKIVRDDVATFTPIASKGVKLLQAFGLLKSVDADALSTAVVDFGGKVAAAAGAGVALIAAGTAVYLAVKGQATPAPAAESTPAADAPAKTLPVGIVGGNLQVQTEDGVKTQQLIPAISPEAAAAAAAEPQRPVQIVG